MRWYKIRALMFMDFKVFKRSKWRFVEFFYFPLTTIIIWGLFAIFTRDFSAETGLMVLGVNVFWSFSYLAQVTTNMQMNEDSWSGSLKQILASGISEFEYLSARLISAVLISALIMVIMISIAVSFGLTVFFQEIYSILLLSGITLGGSLALSILVAGLIMIFGRDYSFLAWSILQIFVLLSAPFYPVEILPDVFQAIAMGMPFTNIFLGVRTLINTGTIPEHVFINGSLIVLVYLAISIPLYYYAFKRARKNGLLAKLS